nr:hypothetical protein [Xanthomonas vasicola]
MTSDIKPLQRRALGLLGLIALLALLPSSAAAEEVYDDYGRLIKTGATIKSPGSQLFGENINLYTGSLELAQTDVELKGNNALEVRIGRRFTVGNPSQGHFKLWDLDIPYMHGVFGFPGGNLRPDGWVVSGDRTSAYARCSSYSRPPGLSNQGGVFDPSEYWRGSFVYRPGAGDQELLVTTAQALRPSDGRTYPIVLKDGSAIRCVPSLDGISETDAQGEGFEVVDTHGTVYTFNHMVSRFYPAIRKSSPGPQPISAGSSIQNASVGKIVPMVANSYILQRREVLIYPTRVTDRFGNTVSYNWNPATPWQLQSIVASDGRRIGVSYAGGDGTLITSVTTSGRTWSYVYSNTTDSVHLPDGSGWTFDLLQLSRARDTSVGYPGCDGERLGSSSGSAAGSIVAPTGARADYALNYMMMGRSWVPRMCRLGYSDIPYKFT